MLSFERLECCFHSLMSILVPKRSCSFPKLPPCKSKRGRDKRSGRTVQKHPQQPRTIVHEFRTGPSLRYTTSSNPAQPRCHAYTTPSQVVPKLHSVQGEPKKLRAHMLAPGYFPEFQCISLRVAQVVLLLARSRSPHHSPRSACLLFYRGFIRKGRGAHTSVCLPAACLSACCALGATARLLRAKYSALGCVRCEWKGAVQRGTLRSQLGSQKAAGLLCCVDCQLPSGARPSSPPAASVLPATSRTQRTTHNLDRTSSRGAVPCAGCRNAAHLISAHCVLRVSPDRRPRALALELYLRAAPSRSSQVLHVQLLERWCVHVHSATQL